MSGDNIPNPNVPEPWRPRFGIGAMLLLMLVFCVMSTAGFYLVQGIRGSGSFQLAFILLTLTAPLFLVVIVSVLRQVILWLNRR